MSDIEARVKKIIAEQLGVPESDVTNDKAFVADLGADSLPTGLTRPRPVTTTRRRVMAAPGGRRSMRARCDQPFWCATA